MELEDGRYEQWLNEKRFEPNGDRNVEPYSIVGGNPAKLIKKRFSDDDIQKLQEMKWWEWDEETLFEAMPILCSNKIDLLYKFFRKMK